VQTRSKSRPSRVAVVVDIGYQGEAVVLAKGLQCRGHVRVEFKPAEDVKIALDPPDIATQAEMREGLAERQFRDVAVATVRFPIVGDVALFSVFKKRPHIDTTAARHVD
jgi:hypothetical protein